MEPDEISWLYKVFKKVDIFSTLTVGEMSNLIDFMKKYNYKKGEKIVKQGDAGDAFYIIYRGKVKIVVKKGFFKTMEVGTLGSEQFFGEMSLLSDEPRTATVIAEEDTDCFVLFKGQFQHLVLRNPTFAAIMQSAREKRAFELRRKQ